MAKVERTGNRIAGVERDRHFVFRFVMAFVLAVTVGLVFVAGGMALGAGRTIPTGFGGSDEVPGVWSVVRWPVGIVVIAVAVLLLFQLAPKASTRALAPPVRRDGGRGRPVGRVHRAAFALLLAQQRLEPVGPAAVDRGVDAVVDARVARLAIWMATAAELSDARRPHEEEAATRPHEQDRSPALSGDRTG